MRSGKVTITTIPKSCLTLEAFQWVVASFFFADKEAVTVQEVGPGHLYPVESMAALLMHRLARAVARLQHLLLLAARGQHRAAQHADLRVAVSAEQGLDHAYEEVLCTRLGLVTGLVAQDVGVHGLSVGHVVAVGQLDICAFG